MSLNNLLPVILPGLLLLPVLLPSILLLLTDSVSGQWKVYPFDPRKTKSPGFNQEVQARSCWSGNIVPYYIGPNFDKTQRAYIAERIGILHGATCIRFIDMAKQPRNYTDVVIFQKIHEGECRTRWERMANDSYVVYIKLLDRCFPQHWVLHQLMHALGFHDEQQRSDRNCFVHIHINAVNYSEFKLMRHDPWLERYPYDKFSVMHTRTSFLMSGQDERWVKSYDPVGNEEGLLSYLDYNKIRYKYCGGRHYCETSPKTCAEFEKGKDEQQCFHYTPWQG